MQLKIFAILILTALGLYGASAQEKTAASVQETAEAPEVSAQEAQAASNLPQVSLLTVGEGADFYQLEGHTALRIKYPDGNDVAVNWGVFDFNAPNFVYRFCKGETMYSIGLAPVDFLLDWYAMEGRRVTEQVLDLNPQQIHAIVQAVAINLLPENQTYRYNYVKDNCATRPLAVIEQALGADGSRLEIEEVTTPATFRSEMRRYHRNYPTYQMGIDLALGSGIDYQINTRERAFAPVFLEELLGNAKIVEADGEVRPAVSQTIQLVEETQAEPREQLPHPAIWAWGIFLVAAIMTAVDFRRRKSARWFDFVFYLIYGLAGCVIAFLVFVSTHEATSPNLNLLWLNPLALAVPIFIFIGKCRRVVRYYHVANLLLIAVFAVMIVAGSQAFNVLFLPLILASALRSFSYLKIQKKCIQN